MFSLLFQCSASRACSQPIASATPAGTGIPRLLPASSEKQRNWTARAKNEYPSRSSHRLIGLLLIDREQVADVGSDHRSGHRVGRRVELPVDLQDRQRL
jgi:hypothetical protein